MLIECFGRERGLIFGAGVSAFLTSAIEPEGERGLAMSVFMLGGMLIGAVLGTRITIHGLIPAAAYAAAIAVASSVLRGLPFGRMLIDLAVLLAFLQAAYTSSAAFSLLLQQRAN